MRRSFFASALVISTCVFATLTPPAYAQEETGTGEVLTVQLKDFKAVHGVQGNNGSESGGGGAEPGGGPSTGGGLGTPVPDPSDPEKEHPDKITGTIIAMGI